jgi:hypothetical protein
MNGPGILDLYPWLEGEALHDWNKATDRIVWLLGTSVFEEGYP